MTRYSESNILNFVGSTTMTPRSFRQGPVESNNQIIFEGGTIKLKTLYKKITQNYDFIKNGSAAREFIALLKEGKD